MDPQTGRKKKQRKACKKMDRRITEWNGEGMDTKREAERRNDFGIVFDAISLGGLRTVRNYGWIEGVRN